MNKLSSHLRIGFSSITKTEVHRLSINDRVKKEASGEIFTILNAPERIVEEDREIYKIEARKQGSSPSGIQIVFMKEKSKNEDFTKVSEESAKPEQGSDAGFNSFGGATASNTPTSVDSANPLYCHPMGIF